MPPKDSAGGKMRHNLLTHWSRLSWKQQTLIKPNMAQLDACAALQNQVLHLWFFSNRIQLLYFGQKTHHTEQFCLIFQVFLSVMNRLEASVHHACRLRNDRQLHLFVVATYPQVLLYVPINCISLCFYLPKHCRLSHLVRDIWCCISFVLRKVDGW